MAKKHRLIFLITIAVGLTLFYFGIDAWMKQKTTGQEPLPPVVLHRPAPENQQKQESQEKPKEQKEITKKQEKKVEKEIQQAETTPKESKPTQKSKIALKSPEQKEKPKEVKKEIEKPKKTEVKKPKKETAKAVKKTRKLRTYKFQVGAFRIKENAYRMLKRAKQYGFKAELKKKGQLYRVYVYTRAENYRKALRTVRKYFKDAIPVRG